MTLKIKQVLTWSLLCFLAMVSCTNENHKTAELNFSDHKYTDKIHLFGNEKTIPPVI